jgi:HAD superfamily hydrolase (TIGR01509 family)
VSERSRPAAVRGVLFDMDGVLVESYEVWFHLIDGAARDLGYPSVSRERFHASWGQGVDADVATFFPRHTAAEVESYYTRHFRDHGAHLRIDPHGVAVMAGLRERGVGVAVITNTPHDLALEILEIAGLAPDVVVGGNDVPSAKPAPDMVVRACEILGVARSEAIVVGDSRFDEEAARAAGVRFAGFRRAGDDRVESLPEVLALVAAPRPGPRS